MEPRERIHSRGASHDVPGGVRGRVPRNSMVWLRPRKPRPRCRSHRLGVLRDRQIYTEPEGTAAGRRRDQSGAKLRIFLSNCHVLTHERQEPVHYGTTRSIEKEPPRVPHAVTPRLCRGYSRQAIAGVCRRRFLHGGCEGPAGKAPVPVHHLGLKAPRKRAVGTIGRWAHNQPDRMWNAMPWEIGVGADAKDRNKDHWLFVNPSQKRLSLNETGLADYRNWAIY